MRGKAFPRILTPGNLLTLIVYSYVHNTLHRMKAAAEAVSLHCSGGHNYPTGLGVTILLDPSPVTSEPLGTPWKLVAWRYVIGPPDDPWITLGSTSTSGLLVVRFLSSGLKSERGTAR